MTKTLTDQAEIVELLYKLKRSEYRGEQAEMNIQRLNVRIDQVRQGWQESQICHAFTFRHFTVNININQIFSMLDIWHESVRLEEISKPYYILKVFSTFV